MAKIHDDVMMILDQCREQIVANMLRHYPTANGERWVTASGRSAAAFKVEADDDSVRLVYSGSDIAPLDSIEYGSGDVPSIDTAERWRQEKMMSGAANLPSAEGIVKGIIRRCGTERHNVPQPWILSEPVAAAVDEIRDTIGSLATTMINDIIKNGRS
ncbi:MAG: hypothetical protein MJZ90_10290 [Bacteroidales bacterium]|nr:hypothetical protein [Bacteroidales bacterium]